MPLEAPEMGEKGLSLCLKSSAKSLRSLRGKTSRKVSDVGATDVHKALTTASAWIRGNALIIN